MEVTRKEDMAAGPAPEAYFTGAVTIDRMQDSAAPSRVNAVRVRFSPGARTAWHTHPLGQLLIVVEGEGWARTEGEEKHTLRPGDTVWIPPGERHWHGATDTSAMVHIAVQEAVDGSAADWLEHVSDSDYLG
jgi:quercetin dioxygenase-like cupin family protein